MFLILMLIIGVESYLSKLNSVDHSVRLLHTNVTASFYSDNFNHKLTAYGEKYDKNKLTAASNILPHNTIVYLKYNNRIIEVRINDKGPFQKQDNKWVSHRKRDIDLSKSAFKYLEVLDSGLINAEMYLFL